VIDAEPSGSTAMEPVTTKGTSAATSFTDPSNSERMSTSMCATASVGGMRHPPPSGTTETVGCAEIDQTGGDTMRSCTTKPNGQAVGCSTS
jgi:hypothetical protein